VQDTNTSKTLASADNFYFSTPGTSQELLEEDRFTTEVVFVVKGFQRQTFKIQEIYFI
jgi:hypothetical protein